LFPSFDVDLEETSREKADSPPLSALCIARTHMNSLILIY